MTTNRELQRIFRELASAGELEGWSSFKVAALRRAARSLGALDVELHELPGERLRSLLGTTAGIGPGTRRRLTEVLATGRLREHDELLRRVPAGLFDVLRIPGLGPKAVRSLWQDVGIESLEDLRRAINEGRLGKRAGMGPRRVLEIEAALAWAQAESRRIPLGVADPVARDLLEQLQAAPGIADVATTGALRRAVEAVEAIDLLAACVDPTAVSAAFAERGGGSEGPLAFAIQAEGRTVPVRLRLVEPTRFGAAHLFTTGPDSYWQALRAHAKTTGHRLEPEGLSKDAPGRDQRSRKLLAATSEEAIFERLGLPPTPAELREICAPTDKPRRGLVEAGQIRSELHSHTTASDGRNDLEELIAIAVRRGYEALAVTEHSPSSALAGGLSAEELVEHAAAVRDADARHPEIRLLAGTEVDILPGGELDYPDDLLAQLDLVVASPHAALAQRPEQATARLVAAARSPHVDILGHPTGRVFGRRPGLEVDMEALALAAAEGGTALEINANWRRLDLRDDHAASAAARGCKIAVNTDAHSERDLDNLSYGVLTARRAGIAARDCLNTWPPDRLVAWLRAEPELRS